MRFDLTPLQVADRFIWIFGHTNQLP
jgi:hypothetical protein